MFPGLLYGKYLPLARLSVTSRKFTTLLFASIVIFRTYLAKSTGSTKSTARALPRAAEVMPWLRLERHLCTSQSYMRYRTFLWCCGRSKCRRVRMIRLHRNCPWSHRIGLKTFSCSMAHRSCREENFSCCTPNLKQKINGHDKSTLWKTNAVPPKACNCCKPAHCPLDGNCLKSAMIYQATVATEDNRPAETYVGLTENSFKTRYSNHKSSFRDSNKRLKH